MTGRLIDADELHEIINWTHMKPPFSKKAVHRYIDMARTVDAKPVRHGHWVRKGLLYHCSACGYGAFKSDFVFGARYCPTCGAKMDERTEE